MRPSYSFVKLALFHDNCIKYLLIDSWSYSDIQGKRRGKTSNRMESVDQWRRMQPSESAGKRVTDGRVWKQVTDKKRAKIFNCWKERENKWPTESMGDYERFPFTKKFRKFRLGCKWNTTFWIVPLEIFRKKRISCKGSPVFPVETSQWKIFVPFTDFSSLSPVPYLSRSFKRPGLPRMEIVTNGKKFSETFCEGKRPM